MASAVRRFLSSTVWKHSCRFELSAPFSPVKHFSFSRTITNWSCRATIRKFINSAWRPCKPWEPAVRHRTIADVVWLSGWATFFVTRYEAASPTGQRRRDRSGRRSRPETAAGLRIGPHCRLFGFGRDRASLIRVCPEEPAPKGQDASRPGTRGLEQGPPRRCGFRPNRSPKPDGSAQRPRL